MNVNEIITRDKEGYLYYFHYPIVYTSSGAKCKDIDEMGIGLCVDTEAFRMLSDTVQTTFFENKRYTVGLMEISSLSLSCGTCSPKHKVCSFKDYRCPIKKHFLSFFAHASN